jgi:hypothetical protein
MGLLKRLRDSEGCAPMPPQVRGGWARVGNIYSVRLVLLLELLAFHSRLIY